MNLKKMFHQFLFLLNKKEKKKIVLSLILLFFAGILEALSIGLILPIAAIVLDQSKLQEYLNYITFISFSDFSYERMIFISLSTLFFVYLIKNIFLLFSEIFQMNFLFKSQNRIEYQFYRNYVELGLKFHKESNSSKLIQTVIGEIRAYFARVIKPTLVLINEIFVVIFITFVIYLSLPLEGFILIFGVTFIFFISYFFTVRKLITRLGEKWQISERGKINLARQGFDAISDVKVYQKENFFIKLYNDFNLIGLKSRKYLSIFQYLPKLLLELIFISFLVFFLIFIVSKGFDVSLILPQITLIVAASFRLMPSVNKLLLASQSIRYGLPLVDHLINEKQKFKNQSFQNEITKSFDEVNSLKISFKNISFGYSNTIPVLKDINLSLQTGKMYGIKGSNGSGKSWLAFIISGLFDATKGEISINDETSESISKKLLKNASYVSQNLFLFDDTFIANITFDRDSSKIKKETFDKVTTLFGIKELANDHIEKMDYKIGENGGNL